MKHLLRPILYTITGGFVLSGAILGLDLLASGFSLVGYLNSRWTRFECSQSFYLQCQPSAIAQSQPTYTLGKNGVVVTPQRDASNVGLNILKQGGNAIDAAVATGYALAVTDPCCGNIGGGGFMVIRFANGKQTFLNFREVAPAAARPDLYLNSRGEVVPNLSLRGYLAVGIPGTVKGLDHALKKYGTLPRQRVMAPAIELAESGFVLRAGDVQILKTGTKTFQRQPNVAKIFLKKNQQPYAVGDRLIQKDLAQTLRLIAQHGSDEFYRGAIAQQVAQASKVNGGILTAADLATYRVSETSPLRCTYRGYEVLTTPPPGGGTTVCQMLKILEGYPLKQWGRRSLQSVHYFLSAMLFAYVDRNTYLGDPNFVQNPVERLLSADYITSIRAQIPKSKAIPPEPFYKGIRQPEGTNTTHYSVQDRWGNSVAMTYTINTTFGAGIIAGNTGFLLNNQMDDFTAKLGAPNVFGLVQGQANAIAPGKRPLSSMSPTIVVKNRKPLIITGSPGGSTIPTTVLQVITNIIDYDMTLEQAVQTPRIHYQGLPNLVATELNAVTPQVAQGLRNMGYKVVPRSRWGAAASIFINPRNGVIYGVSDPRKPAGQAASF
jgi:gamma-glutamyltranspeptidase / glutathione hydrolase